MVDRSAPGSWTALGSGTERGRDLFGRCLKDDSGSARERCAHVATPGLAFVSGGTVAVEPLRSPRRRSRIRGAEGTVGQAIQQNVELVGQSMREFVEDVLRNIHYLGRFRLAHAGQTNPPLRHVDVAALRSSVATTPVSLHLRHDMCSGRLVVLVFMVSTSAVAVSRMISCGSGGPSSVRILMSVIIRLITDTFAPPISMWKYRHADHISHVPSASRSATSSTDLALHTVVLFGHAETMLGATQHIPVTRELRQIDEQPTTATKLGLSLITGPDQIRAVHNHALSILTAAEDAALVTSSTRTDS